MKRYLCNIVLPALVLIGCGSESSVAPEEVKTGIIGQVYRGPIEPVCFADVRCVETFAATFHLISKDVEVLMFQTGPDGNFRLAVAPGDYVIVPGEDAPILFPEGQTRKITVPKGTMVTVRLDFDTGIL